MNRDSVFEDTAGGLWQACRGDEPGAEAFGPFAVARRVVVIPAGRVLPQANLEITQVGHGPTAEGMGLGRRVAPDDEGEWTTFEVAAGCRIEASEHRPRRRRQPPRGHPMLGIGPDGNPRCQHPPDKVVRKINDWLCTECRTSWPAGDAPLRLPVQVLAADADGTPTEVVVDLPGRGRLEGG